jgi:peptidoglycan hydrolase-like protein with peptidoglycan-binding domain
MKFFHAAAALSVFCAFAGLAATTTARSTAHKSTAHQSTPAKSAAKKAAGKRAKGKLVKAPAATWRTRQQAPTPDRYKQIQQALVDKGYLKGEPTGVWDADSASAMQRFQQDQKLTPTGKINAPSLIGLGLGAKSAGAPEAPPIKQEAPPIKQEAPPIKQEAPPIKQQAPPVTPAITPADPQSPPPAQ